MRKLSIVSVMIAVTLLFTGVFTPAYSQSPAAVDTPTFYRLVPGTYVNGYPRFTITYPKDWVERTPILERGGVFRASRPGPVQFPSVSVLVNTYPAPLDKLRDLIMRTYRSISADPTLISDKTIQLPDGSQAQEVETTAIVNGAPRRDLALGVKKGEWWTMITLVSPNGRIGDDLRAILYSIKYEPERDKPVRVPPDVQDFLDRHCKAGVAHDLVTVMSQFSDRYLYSGAMKGAMKGMIGQGLGSINSFEITITDFVPAGDRAYLTGFIISNGAKMALIQTSIIKENGEWKWYGNQRDVAP
jgi:hypothetical protein